MEANGNLREPEVNLLELLQVLVKRKMLVVKICGLAIVGSVIYSLTLPNIYSATAKIIPPQKESAGGLSSLLGQAGGLAALAGGLGGGDLYIGILRSRSVGDAVLKRPEIWAMYQEQTFDQARVSLFGSVVMQGGKDGIISITADHEDPKKAAMIANAYVDELGKATIRLNLSKVGTERAFLEKRLDLVKKELAEAENDLKSYAQQNKIVQVDSQTRASIEGIAKLKADLAAREVQLSVLRSKQTEESPEVKSQKAGLARLKGEIQRLAGSGDEGEGIPAVGTVPTVALEYGRKMRELKAREAMFEQITKQYEMAKLGEAKDSASLQVLDEAVPPAVKSKPKRSTIVVFSTLSAFVASVLLAFILEHLEKMPEADRRLWDRIKKQALAFK